MVSRAPGRAGKVVGEHPLLPSLSRLPRYQLGRRIRERVPKVDGVKSPGQYAAAVQEVLDVLGDPLTRVDTKDAKSNAKSGASIIETRVRRFARPPRIFLKRAVS
jgi:hypothetical protein